MCNKRCFGEGLPFYEEYHDKEWGIPVYDDRLLFELLCLEGAQAGLSWQTVLKRRAGYKQLFHNFVPENVATMTDDELDVCAQNPAIIRHKKKVYSLRNNAHVFLSIQKEFGSFSQFLWNFVDHTPIEGKWHRWEEVPTSTPLSDHIAKTLKKRGMSFVGSTIIYAYMQAVGLVNDHLLSCPARLR